MKTKKLLVTGGAGFIGSHFVRLCIGHGYKIVIADKLTYAGDLTRLRDIRSKFKFYKVDIRNRLKIEKILITEKPEIVVNFASQTHVDRSIKYVCEFLETNILGTQALLDISRKYRIGRFIQISTDEVYGEIKNGSFSEDSFLKPSSPYAASKAAADLLIGAYVRTYKFPAIIVRCCNNYGPWQYPEKFIPLSVLKIIKNEKIPVYGRGRNIREWLYVVDCAEGILDVVEKGKIGEIYNLGSGQKEQNIKIAKMITRILKKGNEYIGFVKDRPGHDIRYSLNSGKVYREIGWKPKIDIKNGLQKVVYWCLENKNWLLSKWKNIYWLYE